MFSGFSRLLAIALVVAVQPVVGCGEVDEAGDTSEAADITADVVADSNGEDASIATDTGKDAGAPECVSYIDCDIGDPGPCRRVTCDNGECLFAHKPDGLTCNDGDVCTDKDACDAGVCVSGGPLGCDDFDDCTQDSCVSALGCRHDPALKGSACDDGHKCTKDDACIGTTCAGVTISCDDDNGCTTDQCSPSKGCVHLPLAGNCDDGDVCTEFDACKSATCVGFAVDDSECDDKDPCTKDTCLSGVGCTHGAVGKDGDACNDGDPCTYGETCKQGKCTPAGKSDCTCKKNADCAGLDDGNACNGVMVCDTAALPFSCTLDTSSVVACSGTSTNPCTAPTCEPKSGSCKYLAKADGTPCDADGDACTHLDACKGAKCEPGAIMLCNDGKPCTLDVCDPKKGCKALAAPLDGKWCDADNNKCTVGDVCKAGVCLAGPATPCDDDNSCTKDLCDPKSGDCYPNVQAHNGQACVVSYDKCAVNPTCKQGVCLAEKSLVCDDGNPCTQGLCVGAHGCVHAVKKDGTACDADGNLCTAPDQCAGGVCLAGAATSCDDANQCTVDSCHNSTGGCAHNGGKLDTYPCNDGDACTKLEKCALGTCKGGEAVVCDDKDPCTIDSCDSKAGGGAALATGCTAVVADIPCEDGDACTKPDQCKAGKCVPGAVQLCLDGNECTEEACDKKVGCVFVAKDGLCNAGGVHGTCYEKACVKELPFGCGLFDDRVVQLGLDAGFGVARTGDSSMVVAGWRVSEHTLQVRGWMAKLNNPQQNEWYRVYSGARQLLGVAVGQGSVAAAVGYNDTCDGVVQVVKLSDGATAVHVKVPEAELLRGVASVHGTFVAVGWKKGAATDALAVGVRENGTIKWKHTEGTAGEDFGLGVSEGLGFGPVMVGTRGAKARIRAANCGSGHASVLGGVGFATALSNEGEVVWRRTYAPDAAAGHDQSGLYAASPMYAGGLILGGVTGQPSKGSWRMWAVRVDRLGQVLWKKVLGPGLVEDVTERGGGGVALVGTQPLPEFPGSPLVILDHAGTLLKQRSYSEKGGPDALTGITQGPGGGLYVAGVTGWNATGHYDARVIRSDPWGQSHCGKSGKCSGQVSACDDGDACTSDDCYFLTGCKHSAAGPTCANGLDTNKDGAPDATLDLDHDGVCDSDACAVKAKDTCPLTWNPDNKADACPPLPAGFSPSVPLLANSVGSAPGAMVRRRTRELVELPLRTGLVDASVVAMLRLDASAKDAGPLKLPVKAVGAGKAEDIQELPLGAVQLGAKGRIEVTKVPGGRLDHATIALRLRAEDSDGEIASLAGVGGAAPTMRLWLNGGVLRCSYAGSDNQLRVLVASEVGDRVLRGRWRHVACTVGGGRFAVLVDGIVAASSPDPVPDAATGATSFFLGAGDGNSTLAGRYDDAVLLARAAEAEPLRGWADSRHAFGTELVNAAQADFDDLRVSAKSPYHKLPVQVATEVVGLARMSDSRPGIIAHWPLAGSGVDVSTSGWHGTLVAASQVRGRYGDSNGALRFGGAGRVVTASKWTIGSAQRFSVQVWARLEKGHDHGLFGALDGKGTGFAVRVVGKGNAPGVSLLQTDDQGNKVAVFAAGNFADGRWRHFGVLREVGVNKRITLFVDGRAVAAKADTTAAAIGGSAPLKLAIGAIATNGSPTDAVRGELCDVVIDDGRGGAAALARRAVGLPRLRMLLSTLPFPDNHGTYHLPALRLHYGGAKLKGSFPEEVALDGKTRCAGVATQCLGIAGWWQLRELGRGAALDSSSPSLAANIGPAAGAIRGREEAARKAVGAAALHVPKSGFDADKPFTLEVGLRMDEPGKGVALEYVTGKRGMRWVGVPAGLALMLTDGAKTAAPVVRLPAGQWATVALLRDAKHQVEAYVERSLAGTADGATLGVVDPESALQIGTATAGFVGAIDEVRVSTRPLAADELIAHPRMSLHRGCEKALDCPELGSCSIPSCSASGFCHYDSKPGCS